MESQVSSVELIERQQALVQTREALKAERVEVMLAGGTFEKSDEIASLDHDITVLDDVIRVAKDRDEAARQAAERAEQERRRQAHRDKLTAGIEAYLAQVAEADKHAAASAAALAAALKTIEGMSGMPYSFGLTGVTSTGIELTYVRDRLGNRVARMLGRHLGNNAFGPLKWMGERLRDEDWEDEERREMMAAREGMFSHSDWLRRERGEA